MDPIKPFFDYPPTQTHPADLPIHTIEAKLNGLCCSPDNQLLLDGQPLRGVAHLNLSATPGVPLKVQLEIIAQTGLQLLVNHDDLQMCYRPPLAVVVGKTEHGRGPFVAIVDTEELESGRKLDGLIMIAVLLRDATEHELKLLRDRGIDGNQYTVVCRDNYDWKIQPADVPAAPEAAPE